MLEDVGEDDGVETAAPQRFAHLVDLRQVGLNRLLDALSRHDHGIAARLDAHDAIGAALDGLRCGGESAADVEDIAAAAVAPQAEEAPIDVLEILVGAGLEHVYVGRSSSA